MRGDPAHTPGLTATFTMRGPAHFAIIIIDNSNADKYTPNYHVRPRPP
jgi:hypothetical protein